MPTSELVEACLEATAALSEIGSHLQDSDAPQNGQEVQAMLIVWFAMGYVMQAAGGDEDDGNPYRYDDDHTFY